MDVETPKSIHSESEPRTHRNNVGKSILRFLRDPLFGSLVAIVALFSPWLVGIFLPQKQLTYRIPIQTPVLSENAKNLDVLIDGKKTADPNVVVVEILNSGNSPILPADIFSPIEIGIVPKASIINAHVTDAKPTAIASRLEVKKDGVELKPTLWNPGDLVQVTMLVDGEYWPVTVTCRIAGISRVHWALQADIWLHAVSMLCIAYGMGVAAVELETRLVMPNLKVRWLIFEITRRQRRDLNVVLAAMILIAGVTLGFNINKIHIWYPGQLADFVEMLAGPPRKAF